MQWLFLLLLELMELQEKDCIRDVHNFWTEYDFDHLYPTLTWTNKLNC